MIFIQELILLKVGGGFFSLEENGNYKLVRFRSFMPIR